MSFLLPVIFAINHQDKLDVLSALYDAGHGYPYGQTKEEALRDVNAHAEIYTSYPCIALDEHGDIRFRYSSILKGENAKRHTLVNSTAHLIAYAKRHIK